MNKETTLILIIAYHWHEVWSTLVQTLEILIKNWDSFSDSPFKETLLNDVAFILVSSIRLGHTYISASSYHYLLVGIALM